MPSTGGRPRKYETVDELDTAIDSYFSQCRQDKVIPTTCGLALALGFCDRQSLYDYKAREMFSGSIKRAIMQIELVHEQRLQENVCAGSIFWLKNHKWTDKQDIGLSTPDGPLQTESKFEIVLKKV
jgi:hypothetical protein